jgi:hypothetical protein
MKSLYARTASAKKNNPEQCPKASFQPKKLLKTLEQKSGFIVEQKFYGLFEQKKTIPKRTQ